MMPLNRGFSAYAACSALIIETGVFDYENKDRQTEKNYAASVVYRIEHIFQRDEKRLAGTGASSFRANCEIYGQN
jgi:hypothetical protein